MDNTNDVTVIDDKHSSLEKASSISSVSKNQNDVEKHEPHFKATLDPVDEVDAVGKFTMSFTYSSYITSRSILLPS